MKISDYIFTELKKLGVKHVFTLPGGGAMHLVDSLGKSGIEYVCVQHEQAAAIMAEAYGQHTNFLGVALVTSGPGATNTITGIAAGWIDSTPMLILSGQAKRSDLVGSKKVRQSGSQEVQITEIVKPITKYAKQILEPEKIRYYFEKAVYEATHGRRGPVLLDIPLDVQACEIEPEMLIGFNAQQEESKDYRLEINKIVELLSISERPLFIVGNGVTASDTVDILYSIIEKHKIPVLTTWKAMDTMDENCEFYAGHPGIMGDRGANYALQKCDLLISMGSRIDNSITAFNETDFAPNAKKVFIDIDINELNKFQMKIDIAVNADLKDFLPQFRDEIYKCDDLCFVKWSIEAKKLHNQYPSVREEHRNKKGFVSAYYFMEILGNILTPNDIISPESSGGASEISVQGYKVKFGQKIKQASGLGSMGFGLPYSVGACLANDRKRTVVINGDGGFQLNIQELETLSRLQLPIKIFIWCNDGYASIRAMQRNNFNGCYVASSRESGQTMPSIAKIAEAYGISTFRATTNSEMEEIVPIVLEHPGTVLCELMMDPNEVVAPRVMAKVGREGSMIPGRLDQMWPIVEENI